VSEEQMQKMRVERNDFDKKRNTRITQALLALIGLGIVLSLNFWYTSYHQRQNDMHWCALMVGLDDRYQALPPQADPAAREFATNIHVLRGKLHCPPS
jgi:hypothetical protein